MDGHTAGVTIMERGGTLIGRGDELELLNQAFARARLRRPATVVIGGDTGIGKSWLVAAFTAQLGTDVVVALGRCLDYEGAGPPFDAFESIIEELPALGAAAVAGRRSPSANFDRPVGIRRRLAEAGSAGPVVAIVEDLHWADPSTRDLFLALAVDPPAGVLLIGTYRTDGLQWNHPLRHILSELERLPTNVRIELAPFSRAETGALLESRTGTAPMDLELDAIFARAAGNPLYTDHLIGGGVGQRARIPGSLRDLVAARFFPLGAAAREELHVAAAIGDVVDRDLLEMVSATDDAGPQGGSRFRAALAELVDARLLALDAQASRYVFSHPMIREVAHAELLPGSREGLHAAIAARLDERDAATGGWRLQQPGGSVAIIAHHLEAAGQWRKALVARVDAGFAADAVHAPATAHGHYSQALWLWDRVSDPERAVGADRARILELAAEAAFGAGLTAAALPLIRAAVDEVAAVGQDDVRLGLLHVRLGRMSWMAGQPDAAVTAYQRAAELVTTDDPAGARAVVLAGLMSNRMVRGRYDELEAGSREAIEKAVDAGDRKTEGHARNTLGVGLAFTGHPEQALASLEAARWIAEDLRDAEEMCRAYTNMSMVLVGLGRPADAADVARSGLEAYRQFEIAPCHGGLLAGNAAHALARLGRWDEAVEMGVDHLDRPVDSGNADLRLTLARVAIGRGQLDRGGRLIDQVRAFDEHDPGSRAALAMLTAELQLAAGRPAYAWRQVEDGRHDARTTGDLLLLAELCRLGVRVERARLASGLRPAARAASIATVESLLAEIDGIVVTAGPNERHGEIAALAAAARAEGSAALGRTDLTLWAISTAAWDACGHRYEAARARVDWAAAILASGGPPATARTALNDAAAVAADLGAEPLRSAIDDVVRRSGLTLGAPAPVRATPARTRPKPERARATPARVPATPARVPTTPARVRATPARVPAKQVRVPATPIPPEPDVDQPRPQLGLTRRELDVLDLLALGRTDPQIAEQLLITSKTASGHIQRIIRKLAVGSRAEAASLGRQSGDGSTATEAPTKEVATNAATEAPTKVATEARTKAPRAPSGEPVTASRLRASPSVAVVRKSPRATGILEDHRMDKKAKTPKKPKQTKTKDGTAKAK